MAGRPPGERQLIDRARGGDPRAYEDLVRLHQQVAFRTALVLTGSTADAEEAVQDAFVKAWFALHRFRPDAPLRPWLLTIVANEARSGRRAAQRRRGWTERAMNEERWAGTAFAASAESEVLEVDSQQRLRATLRTLPAQHRIVLELRYLLDLNEQEMASILGCRRGTVKSRLSRALDRLREGLEEEL